MSRTDSHEFEYPPGLGFLRNNNTTGDRGHMNGYQYGANSMSFSQPDRRPPMGVQGYSMYTGSMPRSIAMQEREYGFGIAELAPNRHTPAGSNSQIPAQPFSSFHHHQHRPSPPPPPPPTSNALYHSPLYNDRDAHLLRHIHNSPPSNPPSHPANLNSSRSTLWWGELEPWMDEEFTKQVCALMGWDPVTVKVPHPAPDPNTGQQPNNPGYCFLTFPTAAHATSVLAQINNGGNGPPVTMPNSSKPFNLNWASSVPSPLPSTSFPLGSGIIPNSQQHYPKEYSIFVGDLAPETSNSDLVAVFRNPVLGLRNDREPKFIRPFVSCKSAKIMLDPVTGVSRGYGFVRFTDESDQQRALIEMHGLYCLSRPMRISPATAKFKAPPAISPLDLPQVQFPTSTNGNGSEHQPHPVTIALPLPNSSQTKSVSAPIAATTSSNSSLNSNTFSEPGSVPSLGGSNSTNSLSSGTGSSTSISSSSFESATSEDMMNLPNNILAQIAQQYANGGTSPEKVNGGRNSITTPFAQEGQQGQGQGDGGAPRYTISEESWKHHAQARAILGNLIGPNGEQLTSTDPYNTTVFVGGLSPLISEETLRTFFAPFGDIHYVKVPVGKHCGFVQFVRKADAERAIEKMQGFPVGGSRIRLSWGRSQYKAAQAAAQAAQASALQTNFTVVPPAAVSAMTQEQMLQLLQTFTTKGYLDNTVGSSSDGSGSDNATITGRVVNETSAGQYTEEKFRSAHIAVREDGPPSFEAYSASGSSGRPAANPASLEPRQPMSNFSPFSPDPNYVAENKRREPASFSRVDMLPHPSKAYAPGFFPVQTQDLKVNTNGNGSVSKVSPTSTRPPSASRYGSFLDSSAPSFQINRAPGRPEAPISRPSSGQTSKLGRGEHEGQEYDVIQDFNGTLASLDLDRPWKSPTESSESSGGSVQFRMTMEASPSP